MKEKILLFMIGLLLGSVITTGAFYVYEKANSCNNTSNNQTMQMPGGNPPSMQNGQPPERPEGETGQPPEMSGENNSQNENQSK